MGYHDLSGRPWVVMEDWADALSGGRQTMQVLGPPPADVGQLPCERWEIGGAGGGTNPSVCVHEGKLRVVLRHDRHLEIATLRERVLEERHVIASDARNALIFSPRDMNPARLFSQNGMLRMVVPWAPDWNVPGIPTVRVAVCSLECADNGSAKISTFYACPSDRYEKNWMPLVHKGGWLVMVYSVDPLVVLDRGVDRGQEYDFDARSVPNAADKGTLRGSTPFVWTGPRELVGVVHQTHALPDGHAYLHRFVCLNEELGYCKIGRPFYLGKLGVEIAAGLTSWQGKLLLSYGTDDMSAERKAWIAEVEPRVVEETFS